MLQCAVLVDSSIKRLVSTKHEHYATACHCRSIRNDAEP